MPALSRRRLCAPPTPAGAVPGGAPLGAHPHPLHLTGSSASSAAAAFAPSAASGRRYFAAPTSRSHSTRFAPQHTGWATASAGASAAFPLRAASSAAETAAAAGLPSIPEGHEDSSEPMLPVP
jgi:hypothetical protein